MTAVQAPASIAWREELTRDLTQATQKTRANWLSVRTVTATLLKAVMPHLEAAYHRGRQAHLRDVGVPVPTLTRPLVEREKQVIIGVARGLSNAAIGRELFIAEDTVKTHLRRVYAKTGKHDRAGSVAVLLLLGEITAQDVLAEPKDAPR
ncbi:LuxR C-terminal-related transcriptional regulator [Streptomyces mirabilis]|uniref:LuxR C-terminal-related transcriptional regulator n=1 Tax=Streptomyces mirabilis TaxID=68239 RepID=UPI0036C65ED1